MAAAIRLRRIGKNVKNRLCYRIVVIDKYRARDGRVIEEIGTYIPSLKSDNFKINKEKYLKWMKNGAVISNTVRTLTKKISASGGK
ncbi:MAG: 30S ribosomal protein S16 [Candidatus Omnitrophota bacterium]